MCQVIVVLQILSVILSVYGQWGGNFMNSPQVMFGNNEKKMKTVNLNGGKNLPGYNQNLNWNSLTNKQSLSNNQGKSNNEKKFFGGISNDLRPNSKSEQWNPYAKNNENSFSSNAETNKYNKQDRNDNNEATNSQPWQTGEKVNKVPSSGNSLFSSNWNDDSNSVQSFYQDSKYFSNSENSKKIPSKNQNSNSFFTSSNNWISENNNDNFNKFNSNKEKKIDSEKKNSKILAKPQYNNENINDQNWLTNKKNKTSFSKITGSDKWDTSSITQKSVVDIENNENSNRENWYSNTQQNQKTSSKKDLSILDELDKNDWYFGSEADFPEIDSYSNVNIDVSELWDFDKRNRLSNSKRRKYRAIFESCTCVNINLCNEENMIVIKEDAEANNWRLVDIPKCNSLTEICCTHPKSKYAQTHKEDLGKEPYLLECGHKTLSENLPENIDENNNIAVGGEFPWTLRVENLRDRTFCGASLIYPQLALTVAHCVAGKQYQDLIITAGLWNSNNEPFQQRDVSKIIIHPNYSEKNPRNDIALLLLNKPFDLTNNVNTICLPVTNDKWFSDSCFVAGWNFEDDATIALRKGLVRFVPQNECQNILLNTYLWQNYVLHDSFVCAIEKKFKSTCLGDRGSAVVCPSKKYANTYLQIGIVSKSLNCNESDQPGIFTNVLKFLDWINQHIFEMEIFDTINIVKV